MALIEFKDLPDTTTPINADNLNNNFNELKPYVLFTGDTNGNVTLSDSTANYTFIEIYYKQGSVFGFTKIYEPNTKEFSVSLRNIYQIGNIHNVVKNYTILNNVISVVRGAYSIDEIDGTGIIGSYTASTEVINITKVIGYK